MVSAEKLRNDRLLNEAKFIPADRRTCETTVLIDRRGAAWRARDFPTWLAWEETHARIASLKKKKEIRRRVADALQNEVTRSIAVRRELTSITRLFSQRQYKYFARRELCCAQITPDLPLRVINSLGGARGDRSKRMKIRGKKRPVVTFYVGRDRELTRNRCLRSHEEASIVAAEGEGAW